MSEDVFRWVVSVGVVLASIAFVFQAVIVAAVYRAGKEAKSSGKDIQNKLEPIIEGCKGIVENTRRILEENRSHIAEITTEASAIVKTAREQTDRIGELIEDTDARARIRIAQIDHAVDETVGRVEQVSETVKAAVIRPATEVNAILNGFKVALNTYAQGRRPSVDHVTQDEEMFI